LQIINVDGIADAGSECVAGSLAVKVMEEVVSYNNTTACKVPAGINSARVVPGIRRQS